jgi:GT2 family glycosyltransferase
VAATSGEILLLNDDTRLHPSCVAELARAWHGNGVYQPRILLADGSGRMDNLGLGFFADGGVWARGRGGPDVEISGVPGCFSGAAVLFARTWWEALGGFDEGLGNFCEDVDLSLRMMRRGWSITPVPAARVEHHLGASWGRSSDKKIRLIERNRVRAGVRSLPSSALLAMPVTTLSRLALFWATQRAGRGAGRDVSSGGATAAMRGIAEGIAAIPEALARRRADRPQWRVGEVEMLGRMWQGRARMVDLWRA